MEDMTHWTFNKDYSDLEQVAQFMPAYTKRYNELKDADKYPYNDDFRGHIGAEGPDEDTAIYLCQSLRHIRELRARVVSALADGYRVLDVVRDVPGRFVSVVHYAYENGETGWQQWQDARILFNERGYGNNSIALLPKGKRTMGHVLTGSVLVKERAS